MEETEKKEDKREHLDGHSNPKLGRTERIKNWFKDPYNLTLVGILLFALAIRLYYFWMTKNQPLWWDEAEYMSSAKGFAGIMNYKLESIRLPGFPLFMSLFFMVRITSEPLMRFLALFIPSILVIILTYILIKEMYPDKKIALISTLIISVLWENVFYSNRFMTENSSLIFQFSALIILFRCYLKGKNLWFIKQKYSLLWVTIFLVMAVFFRPGSIIFVPGLLAFLILIKTKDIIHPKKPIIKFGGILLFILGTIIIFLNLEKIPILSSYYNPDRPIAWTHLNVFYGFYQSLVPWIPSVFFYAFIFGLILFAFDFYIKLPKIKKFDRNGDDLEFKSDIFNALVILSVLFAFIFMIRPASYEYRWFFPLLTGMLAFTSKGIIAFSNYFKEITKNKKVVIALIIIISILGAYTQVVHADKIIKNKVNSYLQVKDSGIWMKENSNKTDVIISDSTPQHSYYSERKVYWLNDTDEGFEKFLNKTKPKYLVVSVFQKDPKWIFTWLTENKHRIVPVKAYFADAKKTQALLVIYKFNY